MPSDLQPLLVWPDYLQASWLRCAHQASATLWHPPHSAKGQTLQSLRQRKRDLLTTGEMALEDLYEFMEGRPCAPRGNLISLATLSTCSSQMRRKW